MKHPGPWRVHKPAERSGYCDHKTIADCIGGYVAGGETVEMDCGGEVLSGIEFADDESERLILAAPELLSSLSRIVSLFKRREAYLLHPLDDETTIHEAIDLIARIEKGEPST